MRIWGKTIASAKKKGIISEEEAQFLLDEYLKEFKVKNGWDGVSHFIPRVFWISKPQSDAMFANEISSIRLLMTSPNTAASTARCYGF